MRKAAQSLRNQLQDEAARRNALEQQLEEQSQRQRQSSVLWEQAKAQRLSMGRMTCPSNRIGFSKA